MNFKSILLIYLKLKKKIIINLFFSILIIIFNIFILYLSSLIFSEIILFKNKFKIINYLFIISILIRFIFLIFTCLKWINHIISHNIIFYFIQKLRNLIFKIFFIKIKISNFLNDKSKLLSLIMINIEMFDNLYLKIILPNIQIFIIFIINIIISYLISKKLFFYTLLITLLIIIIYFIFIYFVCYSYGKKIEIIQNKYISKFILYFKNIEELLIFDKKNIFESNLNKLEEKLSKFKFYKNLIYINYNLLILLLLDFLNIINIYFINLNNKNNLIFSISIIIFNMYKYINYSIYDLIDVFYLYKSILKIKNLFINNNKKKINDNILYEFKNKYCTNIISIYNLYFNYKNKNILNNINLQIKKNNKILIIGHNGSGKSTLFKLITKLIPYNNGKIFIKNLLIEKWKEKLFRNFVKASSQEVYIFNKSLLNNINILSKNINNNVIQDILYKLELNNLFKNKLLNNKHKLYKIPLSSGEKKRIGIARSLLYNSNLLILDEPTNGLNSYLENKAFNLIINKSINKTLIVFTHILKFPKIWDKIYILENGKLIEWGNHFDLIKLKGKYFNYYKNFLFYKKNLINNYIKFD